MHKLTFLHQNFSAFTSCFNYDVNAWKLYLTFSSPFIAHKPPYNCNKLCVFFFNYNTKSHLSVNFEIEYKQ